MITFFQIGYVAHSLLSACVSVPYFETLAETPADYWEFWAGFDAHKED